VDLTAILAADFVIKRGDQRQYLRGTLKANGVAVDLTDALEVHLYLYTKETEQGLARRIATGPLTILDAPAGRWEYPWEADDLQKAGLYQGELEVVWDNGEPQTWPNGKAGAPYFTVGVPEDLGPIAPEE
jgi:hypothetical protein